MNNKYVTKMHVKDLGIVFATGKVIRTLDNGEVLIRLDKLLDANKRERFVGLRIVYTYMRNIFHVLATAVVGVGENKSELNITTRVPAKANMDGTVSLISHGPIDHIQDYKSQEETYRNVIIHPLSRDREPLTEKQYNDVKDGKYDPCDVKIEKSLFENINTKSTQLYSKYIQDLTKELDIVEPEQKSVSSKVQSLI